MFGLFKWRREGAADKARRDILVQADIEARAKYRAASVRLSEAIAAIKIPECPTMNPIDSDGLMKVKVNGAIHRRLVQSVVTVRDFSGIPMHQRALPELRQGEVLLETIGSSIPTIVRTGL